ncbi:esterase-like activity of phytase family protein [Mycobacterium sp. NPDC050551]|uniref:esterase-like activity of phytase family protein n=1 Tax=Mycobacterium sp. NPDC050551 TaxID=3155407 RepID=UPI0034160FB7
MPLRLAVSCMLLLLSGCSAAQAPGAPTGWTYLGGSEVRSGFPFEGTVVGGLSGITYDPGREAYYVISDDRSAKSPARFYTVRIPFADNRFDEVQWVSSTVLRNVDGEPYAPLDADARPPVIPPDPEGIAFDARHQQLFWSSEGARDVENAERPLLLDPWVRVAGLDGGYRGRYPLPPGLAMSAQPSGARANAALEGLTLTPDGTALFAAMEGPTFADGEPPTGSHGALTRITRYDTATGEPAAQYAYPVDPVTAGGDGDNGLSDLVALDGDTFLVVERGYGDRVSARIYRASTAGADDVIGRSSLGAGPPVAAMRKELVVDLTAVPGIGHLDNVEGMTLGPKLSDGRQSVVLVTDDNFSPRQVTQFHVFAM